MSRSKIDYGDFPSSITVWDDRGNAQHIVLTALEDGLWVEAGSVMRIDWTTVGTIQRWLSNQKKENG